ncbi:MAG: hypothetical protein Ct9H300mP8_08430 [Gammaproteobacteria bacterium]|nr:MAG: hypothetical protein Ct9H300mP8_08430 [Gammaproteobacteria bacterium]
MNFPPWLILGPHMARIRFTRCARQSMLDWELGDREATDAAFASADHVTSLDIVNNRLIPNAMEPRAAVGMYEAASGNYTLYTTSQNPHLERLVLAAFVNVAAESKLRVVAPDVGGGFGSKIFVYAEETAVIWAAGKLGCAIKWRADRSESFLADAHGRDHLTRAELALKAEARLWGYVSRRWLTWERIYRSLPRAFPPTSTARCWPGSIERRQFTSRFSQCLPTRPPWTRIEGWQAGGDLRGRAFG